MVSTPASSAGLPDTVTPNTTSLLSVSRDNTSAHDSCSKALTVTPRDRAPAASRAAAPAGIRSSVLRGNAAPRPVPASTEPSAADSSVGPGRPARCRRQTCWLAARSRLASQPM